MKRILLPILLFSTALPSCDKTRGLVDKMRRSINSEISKTGNQNGGPVDPELQKLVDQNAEGIVFRKDLPLPVSFEIHTTHTQDVNLRTIQKSAIENVSTTVTGVETRVMKCERSGEQIRYTLEKSTFTDPLPKGAKEDVKAVVREIAPATKPQIYKKSSSGWKSDASEGMRAVALSRQLAPYFEQLIVDNALAARPLWFGKKRLKIGDKVTVKEDTLPMLLAGNAKGSLSLTLESTSAVAGHPCGVFAVTGTYSRKKVPDFEGVLTDEDISIQSGKIWLSMIYPIVLKQEFDTIQSNQANIGGDGGSTVRSQGSAKVSITREWKKTSAPGK